MRAYSPEAEDADGGVMFSGAPLSVPQPSPALPGQRERAEEKGEDPGGCQE